MSMFGFWNRSEIKIQPKIEVFQILSFQNKNKGFFEVYEHIFSKSQAEIHRDLVAFLI